MASRRLWATARRPLCTVRRRRGGGAGLAGLALGAGRTRRAAGRAAPAMAAGSCTGWAGCGAGVGSGTRGGGVLRLAGSKSVQPDAQVFQVGVGVVQRGVDGRGGVVQVQRGGAELFVHAAQALAQHQHAGGQVAGIFGHAGLLGVGLLLHAAGGAVGQDAGVGQDLARLDAGGLVRSGAGRLRCGFGSRFRPGRRRGGRLRQRLRRRLGGGRRGLGRSRLQPLLQLVALVLPFQHGALALLVAAHIAVGAAFGDLQLFLAVGQLFLALGQVLLGLCGAVGLLLQVALQLFHAGAGVELLFLQLVHLGLELLDLLLVFQLLLLGLAGQCVDVGEHVIPVKAPGLPAESLLRRIRLCRRHGVPPLFLLPVRLPALPQVMRASCAGCSRPVPPRQSSVTGACSGC